MIHPMLPRPNDITKFWGYPTPTLVCALLSPVIDLSPSRGVVYIMVNWRQPDYNITSYIYLSDCEIYGQDRTIIILERKEKFLSLTVIVRQLKYGQWLNLCAYKIVGADKLLLLLRRSSGSCVGNMATTVSYKLCIPSRGLCWTYFLCLFQINNNGFLLHILEAIQGGTLWGPIAYTDACIYSMACRKENILSIHVPGEEQFTSLFFKRV